MVIQAMKFLFSNTTEKRIENLRKQVQNQQEELKNFKIHYDILYSQYIDYFSTLNKLTVDMDVSVWSKDKDNRYIVANPIHCRDVFGIDNTVECMEYVRGKTDTELIKEIFTDRGFVNTFEDISNLSDEYSKSKKEQVHLLEAGYINDDQVLLYVIKFPQFNVNGDYIGMNGIAWDVTAKSSAVINTLNRWIYDGKVSTIFCKDDVFCHALEEMEDEQCDVFKHICPNPTRKNKEYQQIISRMDE